MITSAYASKLCSAAPQADADDSSDLHAHVAHASSAGGSKHEDSRPEPDIHIPSVTERLRIVHRRSLSNPIDRFSEPEPTVYSSVHLSPASHVLEAPPTPELAANSIADTPTSANQEPQTPLYPDMPMAHNAAFDKREPSGASASSVECEPDRIRHDHSRRQTVDTRAIFVGGLETVGPHAWSEEKLRSIFSKYGTVLEVRLMIPSQ